MIAFRKVAIFGASGNFGAPITDALTKAGFEVTIISRRESSATFPDGITVIRIDYTTEELVKVLTGQDAAICVVGPAGTDIGVAMCDAAEAAGVKRFLVNDFGWGPGVRGLPEFSEVHAKRRAQWERAKAKGRGPLGVHVDWYHNRESHRLGKPDQGSAFICEKYLCSQAVVDQALAKFPLMGFDMANRFATIYDQGEENFTD